jgi:LysR family transcriptional regulator, cys regulon transcriptional activator
MTLTQLRIFRELARQALSISATAAALGTAQPGVSRQLQQLERDLGTALLIRRRNRIVALTEAGRAILKTAEHALAAVENIRAIAVDASSSPAQFAVATSHLHARYSLLSPIGAFVRSHPQVRLHLMQAAPDAILDMVEAGDAEIGVSTETERAHRDLVFLAGDAVKRSLVVPEGHPLTRTRRMTLDAVARYPLVTYSFKARGGQIMEDAFRAQGLTPNAVVSAMDADVVIAYIAEGLGIGIVPSMAVAADLPAGLTVIDVTRLFPDSRLTLSLRRDTYLSAHMADFIRSVAPAWTRGAIQRALERRDRQDKIIR